MELARCLVRASSSFLQQAHTDAAVVPLRDKRVISLISATLPVLLWRCRLAPIGIPSLIVESTRAAVAVVQLQFAAAMFVRFCGAPACSVSRTERASADPTTAQSHAVPRRFHAEFAHGVSFPAGAKCCALPGPSASSARHCGGNLGGRLEGENASAPACSSLAAGGRNAEPPAVPLTVVAAPAPTRRTKRKSRRWRLPLQSWLFGPQAIFHPRRATHPGQRRHRSLADRSLPPHRVRARGIVATT
jgi:hypothetical protein